MVLSCAVALPGSSADTKSLRLIEQQLVVKSFYKAFCVFVALRCSSLAAKLFSFWGHQISPPWPQLAM